MDGIRKATYGPEKITLELVATTVAFFNCSPPCVRVYYLIFTGFTRLGSSKRSSKAIEPLLTCLEADK